eukprot:scaffold1521_cov271-Chaetoceros_neogracile.AAC.4
MVFRFRYRKCVVAALLTLAFMLSLLSNLDCTFVNVDVGFVPSNIYDPSSNASEYGIGLWTIEEADSDGLCILPLYVEDNISLTTDDDLYLSFLMSSDAVFTSARFIAFIGCFFGITVVTWAWTSVLFVFKNKSNRVTLNMTLAAFMCEGAKIGLLFMSNPCIDKEFWEKTDPDETQRGNLGFVARKLTEALSSFLEVDESMVESRLLNPKKSRIALNNVRLKPRIIEEDHDCAIEISGCIDNVGAKIVIKPISGTSNTAAKEAKDRLFKFSHDATFKEETNAKNKQPKFIRKVRSSVLLTWRILRKKTNRRVAMRSERRKDIRCTYRASGQSSVVHS